MSPDLGLAVDLRSVRRPATAPNRHSAPHGSDISDPGGAEGAFARRAPARGSVAGRLLRPIVAVLVVAMNLTMGTGTAGAAPGDARPELAAKTTPQATAGPGDTVQYVVNFSCSNNEANADGCDGSVFNDPLPKFTDIHGNLAPVEFVSASGPASVWPSGFTLDTTDPANPFVTGTAGPWPPGNSGSIFVTVRVPRGIVPVAPQVISNTAQVTDPDSPGVRRRLDHGEHHDLGDRTRLVHLEAGPHLDPDEPRRHLGRVGLRPGDLVAVPPLHRHRRARPRHAVRRCVQRRHLHRRRGRARAGRHDLGRRRRGHLDLRRRQPPAAGQRRLLPDERHRPLPLRLRRPVDRGPCERRQRR